MSTWKNAIPKEIPAIIPRLASNAVVIREKQPYKRRIPPPHRIQNNSCYDFVDLGAFRNSRDLTRWYTTDAAVLRSLSSSEVQFTPAVMLQQLLGMPSFLK